MAGAVELGKIQVGNAIFYELEIERDRRLVRIIRTETPYRDLGDIEASSLGITNALLGVDRKRAGALIDLRRTAGRNDSAFEEAIAPHRKVLMNGFARVAILVGTASGKLQIQRHTTQDGATHVAVFMDEKSAIRFLDGTDTPSVRRY